MDGVQQLDESGENPTSSENFGVSMDEREKLNGTVENPSTSEPNEAREDFDQSLQCDEDVPSWFDSMLHTLANSEKEEQVVDTQLKVIKSQKNNNQTQAVSETQNLEDEAARISTVPLEAEDDDTRIIEIDTKNITVPSWFSKLDEPESVKQTTQVVEIQSTEPTSTSTPEDIATWLKTQPKLSASSKSGYIVFSHEVRKRVISENSAATFTEIAKIIGQEWTNLPSSTKKLYDSRAKFIVSEREKLGLTSSYSRILKPGQIRIYMCK
uniref:HMG box domain-containing protein n=1 Tax=Acrobeloides nanus TaxID=290746 RepID=A0A914D0U7_9BILA